jgi:hypothetical protein
MVCLLTWSRMTANNEELGSLLYIAKNTSHVQTRWIEEGVFVASAQGLMCIRGSR